MQKFNKVSLRSLAIEFMVLILISIQRMISDAFCDTRMNPSRDLNGNLMHRFHLAGYRAPMILIIEGISIFSLSMHEPTKGQSRAGTLRQILNTS